MYRIHVNLTLETSPEQFIGTTVAYYPASSTALEPEKPRIIPGDGRVRRYFERIGGRVERVDDLVVARELARDSRELRTEEFRLRAAPREGWQSFIESYVHEAMGKDFARVPTGTIEVYETARPDEKRRLVEFRVGAGVVYSGRVARGPNEHSPL